MWWTVVKIGAAIGAALLALLFIALLVMVTRPALLVGVSGDSLSNSLQGSGGQAACKKAGNDDWTCSREADQGMTRYRVNVDWVGCWKAERVSGPVTEFTPAASDGCIQLGDVFPTDEIGD